MKIASSTLILAALVCAAPALAMDEHKVLTPNEVKWGAAPASIPKGAQAAAVYGDPSKEGLFALRLKIPAGYHIPPHTHRTREPQQPFGDPTPAPGGDPPQDPPRGEA